MDRLGVEEVILALAAPLVLAADVERAAVDGPVRESAVVAGLDLGGDHVQADAADAATASR